MQWSAESAAGFTAGRPWERLQSDSSSITVEAQDHDPASLLNLHRALIHLRAQHSALAPGRIVPVSASSDAALASARRDGRHATVLVANLREAPLLWLAAPVTGLLVPPIVGALSDRTWGALGRRRPYFLTGAILASAALIMMPLSSTLWMAATLLWVLDASINVSMEPFRAFVADKLDVSQRTSGFVMQSLFIGIGASFANALPFLLAWLGVHCNTASGIPLTVKYSFQAGAVVFLLAVMWTVFTTSEFPPEDMAAFGRARKCRLGIQPLLQYILEYISCIQRPILQLH